MVVPSSYNSIYESELCEAGVAICIYANHMLRASYPAMLAVAESILRTAFTTLSEVDVILFALPEDVKPFAPIRDTFEPLQCLKPDATKTRVHACHRGLYLPDLLIRKARVEDHDDLVAVFNAQSEARSCKKESCANWLRSLSLLSLRGLSSRGR